MARLVVLGTGCAAVMTTVAARGVLSAAQEKAPRYALLLAEPSSGSPMGKSSVTALGSCSGSSLAIATAKCWEMWSG